MATLATPFKRAADFLNPNQVKVVLAPSARRALFFSRSPMPYARDRAGVVDDAWVAANPCFKHLGLYGYRADLLSQFAELPMGQLEQIENWSSCACWKTATRSPARSRRTQRLAWIRRKTR